MLIPKIVYEDSNIIICNKPAGILSQPDRSLSESLLDAVKSYRAARGDRGETHIINRLDNIKEILKLKKSKELIEEFDKILKGCE